MTTNDSDDTPKMFQELLVFDQHETTDIPDFVHTLPYLLTIVRRCYKIWVAESDKTLEELQFIAYLTRSIHSTTSFYYHQRTKGSYDKRVIEEVDIPRFKEVVDFMLPLVGKCREVWPPDTVDPDTFTDRMLKSVNLVGYKIYRDRQNKSS